MFIFFTRLVSPSHVANMPTEFKFIMYLLEVLTLSNTSIFTVSAFKKVALTQKFFFRFIYANKQVLETNKS